MNAANGEAADRLLRLIRRLTLTGALWVTVTLIVLPTIAVLGTRPQLLLAMILIVAIPATFCGYLIIVTQNAQLKLGDHAPVQATLGLISLLLLIVIGCSGALVTQQITFDLTANHPTTAVIDGCDEHVGKSARCWGHWTISGQTYSSDSIASAFEGLSAGSTLPELYAPRDPSYVRRPGQVVGPSLIGGGAALLVALFVLARTAPRELRSRRRYLDTVRALKAAAPDTAAPR